jgi:hypothetical protein
MPRCSNSLCQPRIVSSFNKNAAATPSQLHPSSSSTKAFARRVRRDAAEPSRANAIRCPRSSALRKPPRIMPHPNPPIRERQGISPDSSMSQGILHAADNLGVRENAGELGVWPKTVRQWRKRWRQAADAQPVPERLSDVPRCGAPATYTADAMRGESACLLWQSVLEKSLPANRRAWRFGASSEPPESTADAPEWIAAQLVSADAALGLVSCLNTIAAYGTLREPPCTEPYARSCGRGTPQGVFPPDK